MKDKLKKLVKKHRVLDQTIRKLYHKFKDSKPTKIINGIGNNLNFDKSCVLHNCTIHIVGSNNRIEIHDQAVLNNVKFLIRGDNNFIRIGGKVRFNNGGSIWVEDHNCEAIIGDHTTFENSHIAVTEPHSKITIGQDCMFAYDIDLRTGDSHSIIDSTTNARINYAENIAIGNHVWVAAHVSILKGVHISDNSVIATRAVVTKSFKKDNLLIGGIPAKAIKENINWDRQRIYQS